MVQKKENHLFQQIIFVKTGGFKIELKIKSYTNLAAIKYSAIWIVFVAAPFLKLSATIHMFNVFS